MMWHGDRRHHEVRSPSAWLWGPWLGLAASTTDSFQLMRGSVYGALSRWASGPSLPRLHSRTVAAADMAAGA